MRLSRKHLLAIVTVVFCISITRWIADRYATHVLCHTRTSPTGVDVHRFWFKTLRRLLKTEEGLFLMQRFSVAAFATLIDRLTSLPANDASFLLRSYDLDEAAAHRLLSVIATDAEADDTRSCQSCEQNGTSWLPPPIVSPLLKNLGLVTANMAGHPLFSRPSTNFYGRASQRVVIDVGANDGSDHTLPALQRGYIVYSFDPVTAHTDKIVASVTALGLAKRMSIINCIPGQEPVLPNITADVMQDGYLFLFNAAVGAENRPLILSVNGMMSSSDLATAEAGMQKVVPMVRLDTIVKRDVWLLKTDTQGMEGAVLEGSRALFERFHVQYVTLEFWPRALRRTRYSPMDVLLFLRTQQFLCFDFTSNNHIADDRPSQFSAFIDAFDDIAHSPACRRDGCGNIGPWDELFCSKVSVAAAIW